MELHKTSELSVGSASYRITTQLAGDATPTIETRVLGGDGSVVFQTSQDISALKPIFQNSQKVFARIEEQHQSVLRELVEGRLASGETSGAPPPPPTDPETDALEHAVALLGSGNFEKATSSLKAILETFPNCIEARELLEVAYKASSGARLPVEIVPCLTRGTEAYTAGRQREAIESWKQCLTEEPGNRHLQLLVMLATTWSPARREKYASEILSPNNQLMSRARPEEAQALLMVAQTVENGSPPRETGVSEPEPTPAPPQTEPSSLESLVPNASETEAIRVDPSVPPPTPKESGGPAVKETTEPRTAPRPAMRRPMGRARRRSPWRVVGAIAVVALVVAASGLALVWFLSGRRSVPPVRLEQAASLVGSGQYVQAISAYDQILRDYGERAGVYLGRGRAKLASGDVDGGLADLERGHELDPDSRAIAEEIGDVHYSRGNYVEAIQSYRRAFANEQGSAEGRYRLAVSLVQLGNGDEAMEPLRAAIANDPEHGEAQFLYGQLLNARGRHEEAEKALRAAEPHLDAESDFLSQLGIALLGQEKLEAAEELARSFLQSYPSDARARSLLGEIYLAREQHERARAELIQALRTDPQEPRAQLALGRAWLAIGKARSDAQDLAKARQVLASARGVDEGERLLALGQLSLAEGDLEAAQQLLRQSLDQGAPELAVHLSLAETKARANDLVGAAEALQRASGFDSEDPAISLSLAIVYFQLGEAERAADQFLETLHGVGLRIPPGEDSGPVVLPEPYVPAPRRFDINRAIRDSYRKVLAEREEDPTATELRTLGESTTFVLGQS